MLDERWGKVNFWLTFIGFNLTFISSTYSGCSGCRGGFSPIPLCRMGSHEPDLDGWRVRAGISVLVLMVNFAISLRSGKIAGDNPWDAWTLEWATTSPPPPENFTRVPPIRGRRPLWDLAHPDRTDEMVTKLAG